MKVVAKPVDMVAWFDSRGEANPVRFRIESQDSTFIIVKIDRIVFKYMEKLAGNIMLVYRCQSMIDGCERVYEIKYEITKMKWILYKI